MASLEFDLSCPLCLGFFQDLQLLSCGHSFCRSCLEESWRERGEEEQGCPLCRRRSSREDPSPQRGSEEVDLSCSMCRGFQDLLLPSCGHNFCRSCLEEIWSEQGEEEQRCPLCRRRISNNLLPPNMALRKDTESGSLELLEQLKQMKEQMDKVEATVKKITAQPPKNESGSLELLEQLKQMKEQMEKVEATVKKITAQPPKNVSTLNVVLLGKTGSGKSASANTILGREDFKQELSAESVTKTCSNQHTVVDGREITLIDTPGLCDTKMSAEELKREIVKCVEMSVPGPHAFLLVIRLDVRFTEEERNAVKWIQENFGEGALKYTIVLLTHGDVLKGKPVEDFLLKSPALSSLTEHFGGRYHIFNNQSNDSTQVRELKEKIEAMVEKNGGANYTNKMYKEVQRKIRAEKERMKAEEERNEAEKNNNVAQKDLKIASSRRELAEEKENKFKAEESAAEARKTTFKTEESDAKQWRLNYEALQQKNSDIADIAVLGSGAVLTLVAVGATVVTSGAAAPLMLRALAGGVAVTGIGAGVSRLITPKTSEEAREKAEEEGKKEKTAKDNIEKEAAAAAAAKTNAEKAGKEAAEARKAEAVAKTNTANAATVADAAAAAVTVAEAEVAAAAKAVAEARGR